MSLNMHVDIEFAPRHHKGDRRLCGSPRVISAFGYRAHNPLEEAVRKHYGNALVVSREGHEAGFTV